MQNFWINRSASCYLCIPSLHVRADFLTDCWAWYAETGQPLRFPLTDEGKIVGGKDGFFVLRLSHSWVKHLDAYLKDRGWSFWASGHGRYIGVSR